jgi:hypothetical protein
MRIVCGLAGRELLIPACWTFWTFGIYAFRLRADGVVEKRIARYGTHARDRWIAIASVLVTDGTLADEAQLLWLPVDDSTGATRRRDNAGGDATVLH